ncbi:flagellar biosynthesis regulatory protein FlaF [Rhodobacteraceae bacterium RKSG542]|uniref:flagellar biosynthesis regulator FlaF n=1 Tax=Pseudovibrio flavus TaxID=2529854 RepID=UPI0012BD1552|nr:flagellar biosynthesis regulator FlaF [Pseudovibrio flavus]MTI19261.1 flagellar biosynthesis regulatory protein FlaF [Pseudovibrio flavus]
MYHQATQAYQNNATVTGDPRELEATLLLKAATQLTMLKNSWDDIRREERNDILIFNRTAWTVLATEATAEESPLPLEVQNNMANLAMFIFRHTLEIMARPDAEKLEPLITINRSIAAGLRGESEPVK